MKEVLARNSEDGDPDHHGDADAMQDRRDQKEGDQGCEEKMFGVQVINKVEPSPGFAASER